MRECAVCHVFSFRGKPEKKPVFKLVYRKHWIILTTVASRPTGAKTKTLIWHKQRSRIVAKSCPIERICNIIGIIGRSQFRSMFTESLSCHILYMNNKKIECVISVC